ncbi:MULTISPECIES: YjzD family protein [unclassified Enterococcus]|uniref:YjzD family protein n=1 Tax=unclassified Enterococcus TaxID=2608891 RepID=UPI0015554D26|nr:YjzD family protein [Enterococcus sp. MMGLQ5-2]MBS7583177.1 YjzD family protein [Enterococcus sp. MMGLQ5-1]NPD11037.1 YjzD family protein [Enterococcus sp. MMGLQ5-1]NPD35780.1 YjzD family protein [Enterococcus sp. MMGLQ5-2]
MKYFTVLFWSLIFGQVIGYIASSLSGGENNMQLMFFLSIVFAILVIIFTEIAVPNKSEEN